MARWAPDTATQQRRARVGAGYSRFVKAAKFLLPVLALVLVGIVIARLSESPLPPPDVAQKTEDKTAPGQIELVSAQYEGVDDQGRPYTLIADKAARDNNAPDSVLLDSVKADITMEDGTWIAVLAKQGVYETRKAQLSLSGDVSVYHDDGYEMHAKTLDIDMKARHAITKEAVRAQGPVGEINAADMEVKDAGARIVFSGPATIKFFNMGGRSG
ncbi:MAG: LPS export ABC transporter periplasmic protein LptC [Alphaproteobacteria bacterium]|nr:LPS export ABC transporter periplasmic protein LptC [Alphaproteobacteria bacterium]